MSDGAVRDFIHKQVSDPETGWSLGTFGGIAEFTRDADEPVALDADGERLSAVTSRGGIRLHALEGVRPFASETTTRESWNHRVSLCLPHESCAMHRRATLTALGPDTEALRAEDRTALLFDLGLAALHVDLCVRVADGAVADELAALCGRPIFEAGNPAMGLILAANPHRIFESKIGRIEVFQPIPPPHGKSPDGPHTHVMPKLLQHRRTHPATEPAPEGWVPCAHMYPAHPVKDAMGHERPFDRAKATAFESILAAYGEPEIVKLRERVSLALDAGEGPDSVTLPANRFARSSIRVLLRQRKAAQGYDPNLAAWTVAFERSDLLDDAAAADPYEHAS